MDHPKSTDSASRFEAYVEGLVSVIGHADRARPLRDYCVGLMMPCERKSVEPMAAVTAPERTAAQHQSLLHFVGEGRWSDEKVLAKVELSPNFGDGGCRSHRYAQGYGRVWHCWCRRGWIVIHSLAVNQRGVPTPIGTLNH